MGVKVTKRTDGDFTNPAFGSVFLLVGTFGLAHSLLVDIGILGVCATLLWCLCLEGRYISKRSQKTSESLQKQEERVA